MSSTRQLKIFITIGILLYTSSLGYAQEGSNSMSGRAGPHAPFHEGSLHPGSSYGVLTGDYSDSGVDTNGNGKNDGLKLSVEFQINLEAMYNVVAWIGDLSGNQIAWANNQSNLTVGTNIVDLIFDGEVIRESGINGPYKIIRVELRIGDEEDLVDSGNDVYTTSAYNAADFDPPAVEFTGVYSDSGIDTNENTLFDYLRINVGLDAHKGDTYTIIGELETTGGVILGVSSKTVSLGPGTSSVDLDFKGSHIFERKTDGPYKLRRLRISNSTEQPDFSSDAYTTRVYIYTQFENSGIVGTIRTFTE